MLALQGDFEAHGKALARAGAEPVFVRTAAELDGLDGLVIPGGESTTMLKLMDAENLFEPLAEFGRQRPIFGTCAGAILLAADVSHPGAGEPRPDGYRPSSATPTAARSIAAWRSLTPEPNSRSARIRAIWKPCSFARPSFAAWGQRRTCWRATKATRFWWNKAGIWWRRFIRS